MENKTKILITIFIILIISGIITIFCIVKSKNNNYKKDNNDPIIEDNYKEDKYINLDDVAKKDKNLIQSLVKLIPYKNGIYQNIYNGTEVKIDSIKPELLFNLVYDDLDKIKDNEEFNKIKQNNNIENVDFFIKKQDIIDSIKKVYNVDINNMPSNISLIGGEANLYNDYYAFSFASEPFGLVKISKIVSYTTSSNSVVIYEKPIFYEADVEGITLYSDSNGKNKIITIEPSENYMDTLLKYMKDNLSSLETYEIIFSKENNNYFFASINVTSEGK